MADDRHRTISSSSRLTPEAVGAHQFATVRRGYDPGEVRGFLELVARELAAAAEREAELRQLLAEAEHRAAHPEVDEETLTAVLGQETTRVLRAARDAAADVVQRAEEDAARLRSEAQEEADRLQSRVQQRADEQLAQSEQAASELRRRAQEEAASRVEQARAEAEALVAQARAECRAMVHEAQELRTRVLNDLGRRRRQLHLQIDQLRAGRERLAKTIEGVRNAVDQVADELLHAEDDARQAAEAVRLGSGDGIDSHDEEAGAPATLRVEEAAAGAAQAGTGSETGTTGETEETGETGRSVGAEGHDGSGAGDATGPASAPTARPGGAGGDGPFRTVVVPPVEIVGATPAASAAKTAGTPDPTDQPGPDAARDSGDDQPAVGRAAAPHGSGPEGPGGRRPAGRGEGGGRRGSAEVDALFARLRAARQGEQQEVGGPDPSGPAAGEIVDDDDGPAVRLLQRDAKPRPRRRHPNHSPALAGPAGRGGPGQPLAAGATSPEVAVGAGAGLADGAVLVGAEPEPPAEPMARADGAAPLEVEGGSDGTAAGPDGDMSADRGGDVDVATAAIVRAGLAVGEVEPAAPASRVEAGDEAVLQQRDDLVRPVVASLARRLKRCLQDDQNDVLDRLRHQGRRPDEAPLVPDEDAHRQRYVAGTQAVLVEAVEAGATFARSVASELELGAGELADGVAATVASEVASELAGLVVAGLRRRLDDSLDAHGSDSEESRLAEQIGAAFREWKGSRVEDLAADHVVAAFSRGLLEVAPAGAALRWVVDDDGGPCADCDDNALAEQVPGGDVFPTGHRHPPAHAGCRCLLVPVAP